MSPWREASGRVFAAVTHLHIRQLRVVGAVRFARFRRIVAEPEGARAGLAERPAAGDNTAIWPRRRRCHTNGGRHGDRPRRQDRHVGHRRCTACGSDQPRYWTTAAGSGRPPGAGRTASALLRRSHRGGSAMVAPANPADAPCRPPHFSKHPTAGLSRRSTAPHPKASAAGQSSLRPTPSRGSPDGATTRYGKPLGAGVNNSLPASHKNLWKTDCLPQPLGVSALI